MKNDKKIIVTFELDNDTYFEMLRICLHERINIDDFVERALKFFIKTHKQKGGQHAKG